MQNIDKAYIKKVIVLSGDEYFEIFTKIFKNNNNISIEIYYNEGIYYNGIEEKDVYKKMEEYFDTKINAIFVTENPSRVIIEINEACVSNNSITEEKEINPSFDGVEHINIYSKGATELGKMLSNFAKFPIETEDGNFMSVEGYWYYLSIAENEPRREELRKAYGYWAKKLGKEILQETNEGKSSRFDDDFENKILKAIRYKFERNIHLITPELKNLPFEHYYNFGGKVVDVKEKYQWMIDGISQMRDELADWTE